MFAEPEFWVAVAFVILMGVFVYFGIHRTVLTTLDHRSDRIKAELDDARRLKDEAAKLLAEYKARHAPRPPKARSHWPKPRRWPMSAPPRPMPR
jgi:F-type H+-transporting ATPase subunit b